MAGNVTQNTPFDFESRMAEIKRKRDFVTALTQNSLGQQDPTTIDAGAFKVANWSSPLNNFIKQVAGQYMGKGLREDEANTTAEYNRRLGTGLQDYLQTKIGGQPTDVGADTRALDESGAEGAPPRAIMPSKADPIKAMATAMASGIGPLQQMAMGDMANLTKNQLTPEKILELASKGYDIPSVVNAAQTGQIGGLKPKKEYVPQGEMGVTVQGGDVLDKKPVTTYAPPKIDAATGLSMQENNDTHKVQAQQGGNVTPANVMQNDLSKATVDQLKAGRETHGLAVAGLRNISQMQTDMKDIDPSKFGTGAEFRNNVMKFGEMFGATPSQQTAMMENFNQGAGQMILENAKKLAPVTETDIGELKKILGGSGSTKRGMERALDYLAKINAATIDKHDQFVAGMRGMPGVPSDDAGFEGFRKQWAPDFRFVSSPPVGKESAATQAAPSGFQRKPGAPDKFGLYGPPTE
jgi:hypothetical protein